MPVLAAPTAYCLSLCTVLQPSEDPASTRPHPHSKLWHVLQSKWPCWMCLSFLGGEVALDDLCFHTGLQVGPLKPTWLGLIRSASATECESPCRPFVMDFPQRRRVLPSICFGTCRLHHRDPACVMLNQRIADSMNIQIDGMLGRELCSRKLVLKVG